VDHDRSGVASAAWFRRRQVAKAAGAAAPNARTAPASAVTTAAKQVMRRG
jgi:hypothetical protein